MDETDTFNICCPFCPFFLCYNNDEKLYSHFMDASQLLFTLYLSKGQFGITSEVIKMHSAKSIKFYHSKKWIDCKNSYISQRRNIDGGMCEMCHKQLGYIVHHIKWLNDLLYDVPEVALNYSNLMYLCKECHERVHGYCNNERHQKRTAFDEYGNVMPSEQCFDTDKLIET